ncbi:MAG: PTS sugar transporter subunit IIB [Synergistaceae bacterium]|jgi:PTS system galactitol-specific IIB component|nr:PTS sugar transporter subunit IIB [Synergistaceae bacterium]
MKKKILVACGTGGVTSTVATHKIKTLCEENGIQADMIQCGYREIFQYVDETDLIVTTQKTDIPLGKPVVFALAYITGIGEEELNAQILAELKR